MLENNPVNPYPLLGLVLRQRLEAGAVPGAVEAARAWFRDRGRAHFAWASRTRPPRQTSASACSTSGCRRPSATPSIVGMVLEHEPPGTPGVEVRRVETFEDKVAADELSFDSFGLTEEERAAAREGRRERWERVQANPNGVDLVALLDGRIVGTAGASYTEIGLYLGGGNVAVAARGKGVYRALVRARWDVAVERGTPALAVQAGQDVAADPGAPRLPDRVRGPRFLLDESGA